MKAFLIGLAGSVLLGACSQTQLTVNTVDVSTTVDSLYLEQVLSNLSRFIDEPFGIPSQSDIQTGTILTSNSITPSVGFPLSTAVTDTRTAAAAITLAHATTTAGVSGNVAGTQGWQQSWNVVALTDANTLRDLRALYRYVIYNSDLRAEYQVPRTPDGKLDKYWTAEPQCVLCGPSLKVNRKLVAGWLFWTNDPGYVGPVRPPPGDQPNVYLGHYGHHSLYMTSEDFLRGDLANFILFVMPNSEPAAPAAGKPTSGVSQPGRAAAPSGRPGVAPPAPPPSPPVPAFPPAR